MTREALCAGASVEADRSDVKQVFNCQECGACCATYRVSFYWAEATSLGLPDTLVEQMGPFYACMADTNRAAPRCAALEGQVGETVRCRVYGQRPTPCRELQPGDDKCLRARVRNGLSAIA